MKTAILPLLCLSLGIAAGWFAAGESGETAVAPEPTRLSPRQARERSRTHAQAVPADVAARLAPVHAARTPQERLRAVIHLAHTLPVSEMPRWFDAKWLTLQDGSDLNVFYEIARNRWLVEDPAGIIERALSKNWENVHTLSHRWALADPDSALAFLESKDPAERERFQQSMAGALAISRPAEVLALMHACDDASENTYEWSDALKALAQHHPGLLESAKLPGRLRDAARGMLIRSRLERDFSGELARLAESPTGLMDLRGVFNDYESSVKFSKSLLARIDQVPSAWLDGLAPHAHSLVRDHAEAWLALDLEALGMSENHAINFRSVAWQLLAQKDPAKFLENFADVGNGGDPNSDRYLVIALQALNRTSPKQAAQWLAHCEAQTDDEALKQQLRQVVAAGAQAGQKPSAESLLEEFQASQARGELRSDLFYEFANAEPAVQKEFTRVIMAMEPEALAQIGYSKDSFSLERLPGPLRANVITSMIEHPPTEAREGQEVELLRAASNLASQWVREDPAAASRWVAQLPAGETRQWAIRNAAANWMLYDPVRTQAWLNQLPAADRADAQAFLATEGKGD